MEVGGEDIGALLLVLLQELPWESLPLTQLQFLKSRRSIVIGQKGYSFTFCNLEDSCKYWLLIIRGHGTHALPMIVVIMLLTWVKIAKRPPKLRMKEIKQFIMQRWRRRKLWVRSAPIHCCWLRQSKQSCVMARNILLILALENGQRWAMLLHVQLQLMSMEMNTIGRSPCRLYNGRITLQQQPPKETE